LKEEGQCAEFVYKVRGGVFNKTQKGDGCGAQFDLKGGGGGDGSAELAS
jgi:hypothetical protein